MTEVRNVYKNQIVSEDIALGVGKIQQTRRGVTFEGSRINMPVPVFSYAEMSRINPNVTNRVMLEVSSVEYVVYIYQPTATVGVPSNDFPGRWVPQNIQSSIKPVAVHTQTYTTSGADNNKFISFDNSLGCVITAGRAEADFGYGIVPFVPCIVFIRSDTDIDVQVVAAPGVTVKSASTNKLFAKNSAAALIALSVDSWLLVGDLQVV